MKTDQLANEEGADKPGGPLAGFRVVEMTGRGPGPFCAMLLADLGADVVRVARPGTSIDPTEVLARSRTVVEIDLKAPGAAGQVLCLIEAADMLIEGFRPGVMEKLGLGPDECMAQNRALVYGRMTGWGQEGPLAQAAGHDINYVALSGALHGIGRAGEPPGLPLNLIGDFGGGGMLLAVGLLAALLESGRSGRGQVVDAAMLDGAALLSAMFYGLRAAGKWKNQRGVNLLDGGAHFYDVYECLDGRYVSLGAIEPQFYAQLLQKCGLDDDAEFLRQGDRTRWPELKQRLATVMRARSREDWCSLIEGTDACFAPVLDWDEAPHHRHNAARNTFVSVEGVVQPAPAPRFARTPAARPRSSVTDDVEGVLERWRRRP